MKTYKYKFHKMILSLLLIIFVGCSDKELPLKTIENIESSSYSSVLPVKVSLIPPFGYTPSKNFIGFESELYNSSILITEFSQLGKDTINEPENIKVSKKQFKSQGLDLISSQPVSLNSHNGYLYTAIQRANKLIYEKYILMLNIENDSYVISGTVPFSSDSIIKRQIKESILTVIYDKNLKVDKKDFLDFTITKDMKVFIKSEVMSNSLILIGEQPYETAKFIIGKSIGQYRIIDSLEFVKRRFKQIPIFKSTKINEINKVKIENLIGFELIGEGKHPKTKNKTIIYQTILFDSQSYYLFIGQSQSKYEELTKVFQQITKSFKLKAL